MNKQAALYEAHKANSHIFFPLSWRMASSAPNEAAARSCTPPCVAGEDDPILFSFLKAIALPSNDRYPLPTTTHVPRSEEDDTCWSRRCVAEETFGQPSTSLAVCYALLRGTVGYSHTSLLAATRSDVVQRCRNVLTAAQLTALMAHLPLCRTEGRNALSYAERKGLPRLRQSASASFGDATSSRERRLAAQPLPTHILVDDEDEEEYRYSQSHSPYSTGADDMARAVNASATDADAAYAADGFLAARPAPLPLLGPSSSWYAFPRGERGTEGCNERALAQSATPLRPRPPPSGVAPTPLRPTPPPPPQQRWPVFDPLAASRGGVHVIPLNAGPASLYASPYPSTEDVKRGLAAAAAAAGGSGGVSGRIADAMAPFADAASTSFTFHSARLRDLLTAMGAAVMRARPAVSAAPTAKGSQRRRQEQLSSADRLSRRGFRAAIPTVFAPAPPPAATVEDLVVTFDSFALLMEAAHFSAAERRHAQEVWTYEVLDKSMGGWGGGRRGGANSKGRRSPSVPSRPSSARRPPSAASGKADASPWPPSQTSSPYRRRRRLPFATYGSPKYLTWLSGTFLLYEDFAALLEAHRSQFLRLAFRSLAPGGGWYWMKFNFPIDTLPPTPSPQPAAVGSSRDREGARSSVDELGAGGAQQRTPAPTATAVHLHEAVTIPTRVAAGLGMFAAKGVDVLGLEDFVEALHDDVPSLVAFLGSALLAVPSKRSLYETAGAGQSSAQQQSGRVLFGIHRTGKGASGAN